MERSFGKSDRDRNLTFRGLANRKEKRRYDYSHRRMRE